jgi:hypothetical protein
MRKIIKYFEELVVASFTIMLTPRKSVEPIVMFCGASAGLVTLLRAVSLNKSTSW